jgi:SAM-dependent methyltransferase
MALVELDDYALMSDVEDRHWWWSARREIIARALEDYLPAKANGHRPQILEVGCGTGANLETLSQFGDVLGAEHEGAAVEMLRARRGDRFRVIQHSIPDPIPGDFDVVAMFDVLEHLEDDAAALRWVARQLRPGGIVLLTVPAFPFLWSQHDVAAHHYRRYTLESLTAAVPEQFEILHRTYFNTLIFPVVAAVRVGMKLLPERAQPRGTHMALPPSPINWLAYRMFRLERHLVTRRSVPWGVSAMLVLRRRPD